MSVFKWCVLDTACHACVCVFDIIRDSDVRCFVLDRFSGGGGRLESSLEFLKGRVWVRDALTTMMIMLFHCKCNPDIYIDSQVQEDENRVSETRGGETT